ncbi:hypothetical protein RJ640_009964 [Escallonia rubra]|uniref:Reverse transcriptase Ty1/copia-type domain-containing protein n=1 Tax=Escallonia rubra TaxID=112253 RepID=A0AA88R2V7_9ASTE|nr:hypothetical protein RJ640_009964 [Escallonia rubra]
MKSAFLNGYLQEEIYVKQPAGFVVEGLEDKVLKLKNALYSRIDGHFTNQGFRRNKSEPTLYIKTQGNTETLVVSLYVDDLIYIGNSETMIQEFKENMMKTFEMSDLDLMHYFLGIKITQEKENSDRAGSVDDMKSTYGYAFTLGSRIFSWASKKQDTVVQSSAEAEYVAGAIPGKESHHVLSLYMLRCFVLSLVHYLFPSQSNDSQH